MHGYHHILFIGNLGGGRGQNLLLFSSRERPLTAAIPLILRWSLCVPACPAGMFKASQEAEGCAHCPSNSRSPSEASSICTCRTGYYRADFDPPEVACTSKCLVRALGRGVWYKWWACGRGDQDNILRLQHWLQC